MRAGPLFFQYYADKLLKYGFQNTWFTHGPIIMITKHAHKRGPDL